MAIGDISITGSGSAFIANQQYFYPGDEFVKPSPVPQGDLAPCADGRFVEPGGEWANAVRSL